MLVLLGLLVIFDVSKALVDALFEVSELLQVCLLPLDEGAICLTELLVERHELALLVFFDVDLHIVETV